MRDIRINNKKRSFAAMTLVEVLTYLAIFGFIFTVIIQFVISVRETNQRAAQTLDMNKAQIFMIQHINQNLRDADSIDTLNSVFASDNGKLVIVLPDRTVTYQLSSSKLHYLDGASDTSLTDPDYNLNVFRLEQITNDLDQLIGIRLILSTVSIKNTNNTNTIETSFLL